MCDDEEKENDSRADTSMSNSTFVPASGRVDNEKAEVTEDGLLDLSNLTLTNLSRNFGEDYKRVKHLVVSGNNLKCFGYMKLFENLEILDARDSQISKFVAEFNGKLKAIYLAGNSLKQVSQMSRFENLTVLDLSRNQIEEHLELSLKKLEILNLSENGLKRIPDLSKCAALQSINLSDNKIKDLNNLPQLISSANLKLLAVSSNSIDDLSQFSQLAAFKNLVHLYIANNPCIAEIMEAEQFDYRSYIIACCSENLEYIDDEPIEDQVRTQGEWLSLQGGIRKITAGNHRKLCDEILSHFPKNEDGPPTPAQKSCHKALESRKSIQKRNEENRDSDTDRTVNSVYSPFRDWKGKLNKSMDDELMTPKKVRRNLRMCSPPEARKNRSFTFRAEQSPSKLDFPPPRTINSSRTNSTDTVILHSSRLDSCPSADETPTPQPAIDEMKKSTRSPSVADISLDIHDEEELADRVRGLEQTVAELSRHNENLTQINTTLVETLEAMKLEQERMWHAIHRSIPRPHNMTASLYAENEDGQQTHVVRWELPLVQGYEIHVDGNPCGTIVGKNNSARITDLDSTNSHFVQIRAIGLAGIRGESSEKLRIDP